MNARLVKTLHLLGTGLLLNAAFVVAVTFVQIEAYGAVRIFEDILLLRHAETVLSVLGLIYATHLVVVAFKRFLKQRD